MILNGIEYNIRLYIDDEETEKEITEEIFEDFAQMNAFLESTWRLPEYENAKAEYAFVEVVDGKPDIASRYGYELSIYMPMDQDEIDDIIYDMEVIIPKEQEEQKKVFEKNQLFMPSAEQGLPGDASKDIPLKEYVYLCSRCLNEIEECTCSAYPYYLIQIDRLLAPVIRELNIKGYQTSECCAGHLGYRNVSADQFVYIAFREDYQFAIPFPEGAKYRKEGKSLSYDIPDDGKNWDVEKMREYQGESISKLLEWAKALSANME